MFKKILSILLASIAIPCITVVANTPNRTDSVYLFTYHSGPATDGIKLAYSIDKRFWTPISNYSFVKSDYGNWGANKKMYSPSLLCDGGKWYAIWSVNPDVKQFATTYTADFWTWKPQDYPYVNQVKMSLTLFSPNKHRISSFHIARIRTPTLKPEALISRNGALLQLFQSRRIAKERR
ncbi:MAG: hypothetical protein II400_08770 [Bacteroidaceae bacterium]|nr:hypothetical protein [Bacteroidaceae bacterium]